MVDKTNNKGYFFLYEDRYRRLHKQGIRDWIFDPKELAYVSRKLDAFLKYAHCRPGKTSIIEFGCGQGHLAIYLLDKGYKYTGIDISRSAIRDARKKLRAKGKTILLTADITNLKGINDNSYDIAIDNKCLHMLITDEHRHKYLSEIKRVLKNNGKAFFRDGYKTDGLAHNITKLEDFTKTTNTDYTTLNDYAAYIDGKIHKVKLPRIPARPNNEQGYRQELIEAGFKIVFFKKIKEECIFYVKARK